MSSNASPHLILNGVAVAALAIGLNACDSFRNAAGLDKQAPDEFAVVNKAPLIIPPDYNLKPPKPGAAPLNQVSPTISAEAALYNSDDPNVVAKTITGNYSDSEKLLLAQTGAANASDSIRQQIEADNRNMQSADESFTDSLLFSTPADSSDAPLNADAEKARIDASKNANADAKQDAPQIKKEEDKGGWLDGIF